MDISRLLLSRMHCRLSVMILFLYLCELAVEGYGIWQGPLHGKWAEGAYWMIAGLSLELTLYRWTRQ